MYSIYICCYIKCEIMVDDDYNITVNDDDYNITINDYNIYNFIK